MSSKIKDDRQTFESSWNMIESNLYSRTRITIRYNSATSGECGWPIEACPGAPLQSLLLAMHHAAFLIMSP